MNLDAGYGPSPCAVRGFEGPGLRNSHGAPRIESEPESPTLSWREPSPTKSLSPPPCARSWLPYLPGPDAPAMGCLGRKMTGLAGSSVAHTSLGTARQEPAGTWSTK